jgi:thioredoxin 1
MAVVHITTEQQWDELLSTEKYIVADFYADWCGPCKQIAPHYSKLASDKSIPSYLAFAKINVDNVQGLAMQYGVRAMPTFMFFKEGKQVAVNGQAMIQGADVRSLGAASDKLEGLARGKRDAAAKA